jgi:hypothetical protein
MAEMMVVSKKKKLRALSIERAIHTAKGIRLSALDLLTPSESCRSTYLRPTFVLTISASVTDFGRLMLLLGRG